MKRLAFIYSNQANLLDEKFVLVRGLLGFSGPTTMKIKNVYSILKDILERRPDYLVHIQHNSKSFPVFSVYCEEYEDHGSHYSGYYSVATPDEYLKLLSELDDEEKFCYSCYLASFLCDARELEDLKSTVKMAYQSGFKAMMEDLDLKKKELSSKHKQEKEELLALRDKIYNSFAPFI